jgi:hypothetical protein
VRAYFILKEFLKSSPPSPRLLLQLKAMDKFKYEVSKRLDKDLGWTIIMGMWVEYGWAKKFADCYVEGIKFNVLYKKIRSL